MEAAIKQKRVTIWKDFMVTREVWGDRIRWMLWLEMAWRSPKQQDRGGYVELRSRWYCGDVC